MEYKKGNFMINEDYFEEDIRDDTFLVNMILSMIDIDPFKRKKIDEYLHMFISQPSEEDSSISFPQSFHRIFYPLGCSFLLPEFLMADEKIALIYDNFSEVYCK